MAEILIHELAMLQARMAEGVEANHEVAGDMANAIENGNQWHDNSEYDEAVERMKLIDTTFGRIATALSEAVIVEYPEVDAEVVGLGSLVQVSMHGDKFNVAVVGQNLVGAENYQQAWDSEEDLEVTAVAAPMGEALLGKRVGEEAVYSAGDNMMQMDIIGVNQVWMRDTFAKDASLDDAPQVS
jgi:transcription elongation GreA/GreB family factor